MKRIFVSRSKQLPRPHKVWVSLWVWDDWKLAGGKPDSTRCLSWGL